jgi:hypothetical protein
MGELPFTAPSIQERYEYLWKVCELTHFRVCDDNGQLFVGSGASPPHWLRRLASIKPCHECGRERPRSQGGRPLWGEEEQPVSKVSKLLPLRTLLLPVLVNGKISFPFLKVNNVSVIIRCFSAVRLYRLRHPFC